MADLKAQVRAIYEAFETGKVDPVEDLVRHDCIDHNPIPGQPEGIEGLRYIIETYRNGLSSLSIQVCDQIVDGDTCVTRAIFSGTHTGPLLGIPATGRDCAAEVIDIIRFDAEGKAAERWGLVDLGAVLVQLGVAPPPGEAEPTTETTA